MEKPRIAAKQPEVLLGCNAQFFHEQASLLDHKSNGLIGGGGSGIIFPH